MTNNMFGGGYRKIWIDQLRGIAMLLVIFGHQCSWWTEYFVFTSPIKIPLFFAITGYVFNDRNGDTKKFFIKLCKGIIVPWLILSLLPLKLAKAIFVDQSLSVLLNYILAFVSGKTLWYMPCCIAAEIIWFFVLKYIGSKGGKKAVLVNSVIIAVVGYIMSLFNIFDFANINTACIAQLFICIGYLIRSSERNIEMHVFQVTSLCGVIYIALGILSLIVYPGQNIDVHINYYYNIIICVAMIICGCILLFALLHRLNLNAHILTFVGQNTLVYYMLFTYCQKAISTATGSVLPEGFLGLCISMLFGCMLCGLIAMVLNRFFPFTVGKTKPRKG